MNFEKLESITRKIKSLLELATANDKPLEAASAMAKAQELINKYNVELFEETPASLKVISEDWWPKTKMVPGLSPQLPNITNVVCRLFGCFNTVHTNMGFIIRSSMTLYGYQHNLEIVKYSTESVLVQGILDFEIEFKKQHNVTFGDGFWYGFWHALDDKFSINIKQQEGLTVYDPVKAQLDERRANGTPYKTYFNSTLGHEAGKASGANVQIRRGVETVKQGRMIK